MPDPIFVPPDQDALFSAIFRTTVPAMTNAIGDPIITMDGSGRLVIPKEIRRLMHLSSGSALRPAIVGNRLELTPVEEPGPALRRKSGQPFDAVSALAATRESRP
jgi:AbrB family looped-hinge helix DNA binding protein